ncbi:hypothetical protein BHE74_00050523 [Ensete ventricosum]|nr:hypothetical protein BHE74_00050523 [Ensete ventricosum]
MAKPFASGSGCYQFSSRRETSGKRKHRETRSSSSSQKFVRSKAGTGKQGEGEGSGSAKGSLSSKFSRPKRKRKRRRRKRNRRSHILRSIGRKDRHSKVCTAKGPRDRRVRLAAHTAIQFYDVQDRLGYDRPSKAVDWLIKNAKAAIDQLAELPPWSPSTTVAAAYAASSSRRPPLPPSSQSLSTDQGAGEPGNGPIAAAESVVSAGFGFGGGNENPSFLPPSLDTDSIADTIKLFFPVAAAAAAATSPSSSPSIGFQTYSPDVPSRTSSQVKDLRLSLQSFQDPIFPNPESGHHHHFQYHQSPAPPAHNAHFPGSAQIAFDAVPAGWAEQGQRIVPWNVVDSSGGGGGYVFSFPPPQAVPLHSVLGQSQLFCQRGPLQSSNSPAIRAWADPVDATTDHRMQPALHPSISTIGFTSGAGFSGFRIPARFQGEEEHDGITSKPPSASRN